mmetsp:Transcript_6627/g.10152  ORF Transcript_6627/g.10152 Transcript_6627/m.10152 type:complete len:213 (+) Transcript_6627:117-755(+)
MPPVHLQQPHKSGAILRSCLRKPCLSPTSRHILDSKGGIPNYGKIENLDYKKNVKVRSVVRRRRRKKKKKRKKRRVGGDTKGTWGGMSTKTVTFKEEPEIKFVEKLTWTQIRGDFREPNGPDPDYGFIAQQRYKKLCRIGERLMLRRCLKRWRTVSKNINLTVSNKVKKIEISEQVDEINDQWSTGSQSFFRHPVHMSDLCSLSYFGNAVIT